MGEERSGPVRGVRRRRGIAAESAGTPVVVRSRPPRSSGPRATDKSRGRSRRPMATRAEKPRPRKWTLPVTRWREQRRRPGENRETRTRAMRHHRTARGGETDGAALVASRVASLMRPARRLRNIAEKSNSSSADFDDADLAKKRESSLRRRSVMKKKNQPPSKVATNYTNYFTPPTSRHARCTAPTGPPPTRSARTRRAR